MRKKPCYSIIYPKKKLRVDGAIRIDSYSDSTRTKPGMGVVANVNPKYPNPTIAEALCEIHLDRRSDESAFSISRPLSFYQAVADNFPFMENKQDKTVDIFSSQDGTNTISEKVSPRLQFFADDRRSLIQLADNGGVITYNVLAPYPGWEVLLGKLMENWPSICDVLKPKSINRVGLRYINRVPCEKNEKLSDWLTANEFLPERLIQSYEPYEFRAAFRTRGSSEIIINLKSFDGTPPGFIFDINVIWNNTTDTSVDVIKETLAKLHEDEWEVFRSSITEKYLGLMSNAQSTVLAK